MASNLVTAIISKTPGVANTTDVSEVTDPQEERFKEIITTIRYCFLPIVVMGTCTNTLNIVVFSSGRMLSHSTSNFLLMLAISDFGLLYFQVRKIVMHIK